MATTPQRRARGERAGLSREQVVSKAVELVDTQGANKLTLRGLAERLGVDPMTIYWYVADRNELVDAVVAAVAREIEMPSEGFWYQRVAGAARAHRQVFLAHPHVLELAKTRSSLSPEVWGGTETLLELIASKIGQRAAVRWLRVLAAYVNGYLMLEQRPLIARRTTALELGEDLELVGSAFITEASDGDEDFEAGLASIIRGLRSEKTLPPQC